MSLFHEEEVITRTQAQAVAGILAAFDCLAPARLQILSQGGRLLDDLYVDLWRSVRDHPVIDDFFCIMENTTRTLATKHRDAGAIEGNQIFLVALAVQAAIVAILMADHNSPETTQLLAAPWHRATAS